MCYNHWEYRFWRDFNVWQYIPLISMFIRIFEMDQFLATWTAVRSASPVIIVTWWEESISSETTSTASSFSGEEVTKNPAKVSSHSAFIDFTSKIIDLCIWHGVFGSYSPIWPLEHEVIRPIFVLIDGWGLHDICQAEKSLSKGDSSEISNYR